MLTSNLNSLNQTNSIKYLPTLKYKLKRIPLPSTECELELSWFLILKQRKERRHLFSQDLRVLSNVSVLNLLEFLPGHR